jgi:hypothetical protein
MHALLLDELPGMFGCRARIGTVVAGDEFDLAPVDAAALVDHVEISGFRPADRSEGGQRAGVGHDVADADFGVGHAGGRSLHGCGGQHCDDKTQRSCGFSYYVHQHALERQADKGL